jgi:hypothetical protein
MLLYIKIGVKMLKRQQVLLEDWMIDQLKGMSEKYDVSFSEILRLTLCVEFIDTTIRLYPKYKSGFSKEEMIKIQKKVLKETQTAEKSHQLMSKIYFEARKALEFRTAQNKKTRGRH